MTLADTPPPIPPYILEYLADRDRQRDEGVRARLAALTSREQRLVKEAAVMGWVLGARSVPGSASVQIPPDSQIVWAVVAHCATSDRFPTIRRAGSRKRAGQTEGGDSG